MKRLWKRIRECPACPLHVKCYKRGHWPCGNKTCYVSKKKRPAKASQAVE